MNTYRLGQLSGEMRGKITGLLDELVTIREASKVTEQRNRTLRDELSETLAVIGIVPGDTMDAEDMGLRIRMVKQTSRRLDRSVLERLGVAPQVLQEATIQKEGNLHLRLERLA